MAAFGCETICHLAECLERPPRRRRSARPAICHHLSRSSLHLGGRTAHAGGPGDRPHRVGMGDRHVHARLLSLRNSDRHDGRPHRPAARPHPHRGVVVGVHRPDRRDDGSLSLAAHQVPVRGRGGRRLSECVRGGVAMVPSAAARHDVRREPDGESGGRRHRAAAGVADPDALRLADVVLRIRRSGTGLGGGLVCVVPRFARREA